MARVGQAYRAAGVGCLYLVHGTFAGVDATGLLTELGRWFPAAEQALGRWGKQLFDALAGDLGNYTRGYAQRLAEGLSGGGSAAGPDVRLFHWSSENHHLGRAGGAVRLIDELASRQPPPGTRMLLWGHSHAGNVFALATHLLAGEPKCAARFFRAARWHYRWRWTGTVDRPVWRRVQTLLRDDPRPLAGHPLDLVTFGTPIRYGWDERGCDNLLHFVHHRPVPGMPPYRAKFPPTLDEVLRAAGGDYVQQLGIAGTNTPPGILAWRSWLADRRLHALLQGEGSSRDLLSRLALGQRVADAGTTLLVDYGPIAGSVAQHAAGHAVYTQEAWMLFHAEQIAQRLYGAGPLVS